MKNTTNSSIGKVYLKVKARINDEASFTGGKQPTSAGKQKINSPLFTLSPEQYWAGPTCYFNRRK